MSRQAEYVKDVYVDDPDTGETVRVEIYRDPGTSRIFGLEGDYLEDAFASNSEPVELRSPYAGGTVAIVPW